jgi:PAS domain S-box-containing protein
VTREHRLKRWRVPVGFFVVSVVVLVTTLTMSVMASQQVARLDASIELTERAVDGNVRTLSQVQRELLRLNAALRTDGTSAEDVELHRALTAQRVTEATLDYQRFVLGDDALLEESRRLARRWTGDVDPEVKALVRAGDGAPAERAAVLRSLTALELDYNRLISDAEIARKTHAAEATRVTQSLITTTYWLLGGLVVAFVAFLGLAGRSVREILAAHHAYAEATAALEDVKEQLQLHSFVVQNTDNLVVITDVEGRVEWVNEAFTRRTGYPLAEMVGRTPGSVLQGPGTDPATQRMMRDRIAERAGFTCEVLNYTKTGEPYWAQVEVRPIAASDGSLRGFVAMESDITERRAAELTLEAARQAAEETAREKAGFLASMSHEIRTPLNAVLGLTELLMDTELDDQQREYLSTARHSGQLLLELLSSILDFTALESGRAELNLVPVSVGELLGEVDSMFAADAVRRGLTLGWSVAPGTPERLMLDPVRLHQLLINLVGNGLKFTPEGGVHVSASASQAGAGEVVLELAVRDTGIGISLPRQARIFRPFTQADASTTRLYGGTGLGLAICRAIADRMGGTLTVTSSPGRGSAFVFRAPVQVAERAVRPREVHRPPVPAERDERPPLRVLLAEDDSVSRMVAQHMLRRLDIEADVAVDGAEAIAAASRHRYDVVLMDVHMPRVDGVEATLRIRQAHGSEGPRIVALTANALEGDRERLLACGMDDYLSKPVQLSDLARVLEDARSGTGGGPVSQVGRPRFPHPLGGSSGRSWSTEHISTM